MNAGLVMYYSVGIAATFVAAVLAFALALRRRWKAPRWVLIAAIAFVPAFLLVAQLLKFASLHMYADFSHWLQLFQSIVHTGVPIVMNQGLGVPGTAHYFSVHFVPLTYVLAVPFVLLPRAETLIVLNVLIMSSAAIPLYLLARHRTGDRRFALTCAALLLWYPTFQYVTLYEFEMLRFSIPLIFWMLYAWERQRIGWYYVFVLLATLVREEVGLTVGTFGLLLTVRGARRHGIATLLAGFSAFALITNVLMPFFRSGAFEHVAIGAFGEFGWTPLAIVRGVLAHPLRAMAIALHPVKIANLLMLLVPLIGIPLLASPVLIPVLPTIAIALLSASLAHSSYFLYYVAPAIPFLFLGLIAAWPKMLRWCERRAALRSHVAESQVRGAAMVALCTGVLATGIAFGPTPIALQFWSDRFRPAPFRTQSFHWSTYRVTAHHRALDAVIARIPDGAIVAAPQYLLSRLIRQQGALALPRLESADGMFRAEYVLMDETNNGLSPESPAFVDVDMRTTVEHDAERWREVAAQDGFRLFRRRADDRNAEGSLQ